MNSAKADLFVVCCIDPRFRLAVERFIEHRFRVPPDRYDLKTDAGGAREIALGSEAGKWIIKNLEIAAHKHGISKVVLCNHMDCSYYGGAAAFRGIRQQVQKHADDIREAAAKIRAQFPKLETYGYVVTREDKYVFEPVELSILVTSRI
jgi:hypothetical protein